MKKRILSIVLAVLMLVSVLPVTAMAADGTTDTGAEGTQTAVGAVSTDGAIHVNKSVVTDAETGKTSLELEAFATNTVSTETTYDPLDIVLVLDVSGSMDDNKITSYKYTETKKDEWSCDDIYKSSVYYYYKDSEGYYRRVDWDSEGGGWFSGPYRCWITAGGTRIGNKVSNWNDVSYRGKLYTRTNEGSVTRMAAMQAAVNAFIDNVAAQKDSKGKAIENHISIVKFAGKMQTPNQYKVGNNTYKEDGYTYNYSQIVKDMTDVSTGSAALKAAVNSLKAGGATSADYGMQLASHVLSQHKDNPVRRSVVIMFTDGEPNHSRDFDEDVAKDAIAAAKGLKEKNTVVFTIGIFNGANPNASVTSNNTSDTNKYMHAVSSNYPGAAYIKTEDFWSTSWDWSFGERAKDSNYYLAASNAADLEDIFVEISNEVNSLAVKIDATSVLSDTLSGAFDFNAPENAEYSGITVAKYPVTGMENGVYAWGAAQELAIGEGEGKVQVEVSGKKLEVTGFDYGANAVTTKTEGGSTAYSGYKLVVTIPIKPDTEYHGWADGANYYDTNSTANGSKAGLEYGETGSRQKLKLNDSPEAPVTGYTVRYQFTNNGPESARLPDAAVYIEGQQYEIAGGYNVDGWTFTGWCPDEDGATTLSDRQIMGTEPVTYYGKWEQKQPGVSVEKTAKRIRNGIEEDLPSGTGTVRVDDTIKYTVKATNTGNVELRNVSILECFGGRNKFEDDKTKQKVSGLFDRYGFTIAQTLAPGATATRTFTYVVTDADEDHGEIKNHLSMQEATYFDGQKDAKIPSKTAPSHEVKVEKPHGVTYTFENYDNLPTEVQTLRPTQDANKYYKGDSVILPTLTDTTKQVGSTTYTFDGWYVNGGKVTGSTYTMGDKDVTFVGKWTKEEQPPKTATLRFEFKSGTDGKDLPASDMPPVPNDVTEEVGTAVQLTNYTETVNDEGNKGKWTFGGWFEGESLTQAIAGDSYQIPEGGKTLYGKWTFTKDKPEITEAGYTVKYYRQDADGKYSNKPYYTRTTTDAGAPLKGEVGDTVRIEDLEPYYEEHYATSGYEFDEDAENVLSLKLKADASENVLKLYYKAEATMRLRKTYEAYRDGELLDLSDGEELKAGDVIKYTITLKNTGTRNLTNVTVKDIFTGAEGELVFISGDAYEIDEDTGIISLKDTLKPGETVVIRADYEVQLNDSGWRITNEVWGDAAELPPAGKPHASVTITPEALKNYEIHVSADKYVKSVKGTFNKDEEDVDFTFAVSSDKRGKNELGRFDITVDKSVKAGETSSRFDGGITIRLTEEEFDDLKWETFEGDGKKYPVVYLREVKGSDKKMRYDTSVVTLYLLVPQVIVTSHDPIYKTTSLNAWVDPTDTTLWPEFTNVYGKESSSSDTVKVGPQLNRDDHVAYIMGYPDGTVQPEGEITRAEACTIFFRLLTESSRDYYFSKTNDYTDVNAGDWFNNAISTLSNAGIVTGYNDGAFRPNQPITRGEMAKIIANFANLNKGTKSFTDLSGHWSKTYVELAAGNGWIAGYPDGSFRPDQKITRAETVTMINRVLERVPAKELRLLSRSIMLTFPDNNPGDWYYIAIQEASNSHEYRRSVYETTGDEMWTKLIDNVDWTKLEK